MTRYYYKIKKSVLNDQYYWVLHAGNGEAIAKSSEYHPLRSTAEHSIRLNQENAHTTDIRE